jgi:hypothetical protein
MDNDEHDWGQMAVRNQKDLAIDAWMPRWLECSEKFVFY